MINFDKDRSGKISVEEFFRGLQGDMKRRRKLIVREAYDMLDKDGSGEVTVNDIKGAYDCSEHEKVLSGEYVGRASEAVRTPAGPLVEPSNCTLLR